MSTQPQPRLVPVQGLLTYRSGEARLLCARGHVAGHPRFCPNGCRPFLGAVTVADVLPFKEDRKVARLMRVLSDPNSGLHPSQVEDGWLINGHHRIAAAARLGLDAMLVVDVSGLLAEQRAWHDQLRVRAFPQLTSGR